MSHMSPIVVMNGVEKLDLCSKALGSLIEVSQRAIAGPRVPDALRAAADDIKAASTFSIEGGNPLGPQCLLLLDVLSHLDAARVQLSPLARQWEMVAGALLPMVQDALHDTLEQRRSQRSRERTP